MAKRRVGIIGDPVTHSISPVMQQPAIDALGIDAVYEKWPTTASELPARIASIREPDALGANVTAPHKLAVMELIDEVTPLARRIGAVNTIVNRGGHLVGDNTDAHGFAASVTAAFPGIRLERAVMLGAGGAARAVTLALETLGAAEVVVWNRDRAKAERLKDDIAPDLLRPIDSDLESLRRELARASLLVNATSLGWHRGETPLPLDLIGLLPSTAVVADLVYRDTDLLLAARERGLGALDGLGMLVHQGARGLELWTGKTAPVDLMMAAAVAERAKRA
jgi:shikimate dehydrogenase